MSSTFTPGADRKFHPNQEQNSNTKTPDQIYVTYTPFFAATKEFFDKLVNTSPEQKVTGEQTAKNKNTCR